MMPKGTSVSRGLQRWAEIVWDLGSASLSADEPSSSTTQPEGATGTTEDEAVDAMALENSSTSGESGTEKQSRSDAT